MNNNYTCDIKRKIIPKRVWYNGKQKEIEWIDNSLKINVITIKVKNDKFNEVFIKTRHPNSNPENGEFCLPKMIRGLKVNEKNFSKLIYMIETYNLTDCYEIPYGYFKVKGGLT